jgi:hypothetical protein
MADVIELLRVIIWPITTLSIVLVLRVELQRFARNVADRIQSADTVTIGPKGLEFKGLIEVAPLPSDLQQRKVKLSRFIRAINSKARLDAIANALGVAKSTDVRAQKNEIILEINRRVADSRDMDIISASLSGVTGENF